MVEVWLAFITIFLVSMCTCACMWCVCMHVCSCVCLCVCVRVARICACMHYRRLGLLSVHDY